MSPMVTCEICKQKIESKKALLCSRCKKYFEFDCTGYSEKLYLLKDIDSRKKWMCKICKENSKPSNTEPSFVTTRKKPFTPEIAKKNSPVVTQTPIQSTPKNTSCHSEDSHVLTLQNISLDNSPSMSDQLLSRSMYCTVTDAIDVQELKETINGLQLELASTQEELENYILENNALRDQNSKLLKENNVLKTLCQSPIQDNSIIKSTKKKSKPYTQLTKVSLLSPPSSPTQRQSLITDDQLNLQRQITEFQQKLSDVQIEIETLNKHIHKLKLKLHDTNSSRSPPCNKLTPTPAKKNDNGKRIFIYGSQQCVGLSSALIRSRKNTTYEKYTITSQTKPDALTTDILKDCHNVDLTPNDKLILCIGENDYDIKILTSQLRKLLTTFKNNDILLLNVFKNKYINIYALNNSILKICNEFKRCHFVTCTNETIFDMCNSINFLIDYIDYEKKYLDVREIKKLIGRDNNPMTQKTGVNIYPKGTIPYYFKRQSTFTTTTKTEVKKPKPKYLITDFFPIDNKKNFFRVPNI
ncbi:unnamed protein product [Parnassius mnemosyne]|uniref:PHD-type domain-containing protein n=1 Tax=Parnassius mnemosyne TaxID=213953 RepID=A0AAV1KHR2_9NEOP